MVPVWTFKHCPENENEIAELVAETPVDCAQKTPITKMKSKTKNKGTKNWK